MNVLVTGGHGFLGSYIVNRLLDRGFYVRIFGRSVNAFSVPEGVSFYQGNLCDLRALERAVQGIDCVFHVASKTGIWGKWDDFFETNVLGTRNVITACKRSRVKKLVYTSTPSVVFNGKDIQGGDESMPYGKKWLCSYAQTKAIAEREILQANEKHGLRTTAIRPHLIWGIGDPHLIPQIIQRARDKKLMIIGSADNLVDITHVENAAHAHMLASDALDSGIAAGKAYFISDGLPVSLWGWINELLLRVGELPVTRTISFKKSLLHGFLV